MATDFEGSDQQRSLGVLESLFHFIGILSNFIWGLSELVAALSGVS
ncbi:MAG TPA: hypothetical protein VGK74_14910 [Symbiobacteriaceae bacterium]